MSYEHLVVDGRIWMDRVNANTALVLDLCYRFINICKLYLVKIDEEPVKNNYMLISGQYWFFSSSQYVRCT